MFVGTRQNLPGILHAAARYVVVIKALLLWIGEEINVAVFAIGDERYFDKLVCGIFRTREMIHDDLLDKAREALDVRGISGLSLSRLRHIYQQTRLCGIFAA